MGSATPPAANEFDVAVVNVSALAVPLSLSLTISFCPLTGVPLIALKVSATSRAVNSYMSVVSPAIVAGLVVVVPEDARGVMALLVSVLVDEMVGTTTPSTANTPALDLDRVVSVA